MALLFAVGRTDRPRRAYFIAAAAAATNFEGYMKSEARPSPLGYELDDFLFASLGEDRNGLPLSVVSLFARMDLDPWQEAGILAALPREAATKRLAGSLDTLTDPQLRKTNFEATVLRLLALLPRARAAVRTPV